VTIYPAAREVLSVHAMLIELFGGSHGVRDTGALESALARPQIGYYRDLIEEGAALWENLSQNHPFIDGNKRVAVTITAAFLRINGYRLEFTPLSRSCWTSTRPVACRFGELDAWLRQHVVSE